MPFESENLGGCSTHGPLYVCGHTSANCPDLKEGQRVLESPTLTQYKQKLVFENHKKTLSEPVGLEIPDEIRQDQLDTVLRAETMDKFFLASHPLVDLEDNRARFESRLAKSPEGVNQMDLIDKFKKGVGQRVAEVIGEKKSPERILSELKYDSQDLAGKIERLNKKLESLDPESAETYGIVGIELPRLKEILLKTEMRLKEEEEKRKGK